MTGGHPGLAGALASAEAASPVESVDVVAADLRKRLHATVVSFLITDFSGNAVVRLGTSRHGEGGTEGAWEVERVELAGTVFEEVIRTQQLRLEPCGPGTTRVIAPVTTRGDSIGILDVMVPGNPGTAALQEIGEAAHALAYIIVANRRFTDLYQWGRRSTPLSLAAEIQHQLLPPALACEAGQFAVAGALEPSDNVGGDTFDYTLDRDTLHLSLTDAMGHDVASALLATLLVGALRGARRAGATLAEQARLADEAVTEHSRHALATGQLLRIDLHDDRAGIVNAGHPLPLRLRDGRSQEVPLSADLPFGAPFPHTYTVQSLDMRPGDRLIMFTDGMLERSAEDIDLPTMIERTADLHPREVARTLTAAVLSAHGGHLRDDATVLCLDWYGGEHPLRDAARGADLATASPPLPGG
ncbi:PP2C family protein-serine/threonine phosphatase [Streptomyces sp. NPDC046831]|uniref:PP2C family protein-serine/threonine phosphatase n=1 Tax=Streptomyces sp. NPDC046831 TaxID=3154805 RepID=UPI003402FD1C